MNQVEVRLSGLDNVVRALERLPGGIAGKGGGIARKALRAGAKIVLAQAKVNLARSIAAPGKTGITDSTGFTVEQLRAKVPKLAIKRRFLGGQAGEMMVVTTSGATHPTSKGKYRRRTIKANDIAFILEAGSANIQALPWLRPAFLSTAQRALGVIERTMARDVERLWKQQFGSRVPLP